MKTFLCTALCIAPAVAGAQSVYTLPQPVISQKDYYYDNGTGIFQSVSQGLSNLGPYVNVTLTSGNQYDFLTASGSEMMRLISSVSGAGTSCYPMMSVTGTALQVYAGGNCSGWTLSGSAGAGGVLNLGLGQDATTWGGNVKAYSYDSGALVLENSVGNTMAYFTNEASTLQASCFPYLQGNAGYTGTVAAFRGIVGGSLSSCNLALQAAGGSVINQGSFADTGYITISSGSTSTLNAGVSEVFFSGSTFATYSLAMACCGGTGDGQYLRIICQAQVTALTFNSVNYGACTNASSPYSIVLQYKSSSTSWVRLQ